ncbi:MULTISPECIES: hypothetical protein [Chelatococcus]|uniref:Uncharacterized protein n=1 Tax=Chelatococcus caeni TaxID=1348468 RepID=A0A840C4W9_9HYPH|nr:MULTISPECIES: hypothetical protein [Chelatococcus]MBB4017447.1 hypothetical protein [Chelatococcus caeni]
MMTVRLANEYLAGPVFCPDSEKMGHIDVDDLPISEELKRAILAWDDEYQATFNSEYPPDSGFKSSDLEAVHIIKGAELAKRLQKELGNNYTVEYKP